MKQNIAYKDAKFEHVGLLDEVCLIYPHLLEVRKECPNIYKDFEKCSDDDFGIKMVNFDVSNFSNQN